MTTTTRTIAITGASRGIGHAAADALVSDGWLVIGIARRAPAHFPGTFIEADLGDREETERVGKRLVASGHVLGIVNNVGLARHEAFEEVHPDAFASVVDRFCSASRKKSADRSLC